MFFTNRQEAGTLLAKKLLEYEPQHPLILALPRGGVPVAAEIARSLNARMEVLIVRKIGAPFQPELAVGAICEDGNPFWNKVLLTHVGLNREDLASVVEAEKNKIKRQTESFRGGRKLTALKNETVIVVDDGLATGATATAAVQYLRKQGAAKIIVAVPVAASDSAAALREMVDELVILSERDDLTSIGQWYLDFSQVSDDEVIALLAAGTSRSPHSAADQDLRGY